MADLDRAELLSTLAQLSDTDDDVALDAAQAAAALVADAGLEWQDIILTQDALAEIEISTAQPEAAPATNANLGKASNNDEARDLIDRLLQRKSLYEGTRDELQAYKDDIAAGEFDKQDLAYLNALYARVVAGGSKNSG